jgi:hypothetical protein
LLPEGRDPLGYVSQLVPLLFEASLKFVLPFEVEVQLLLDLQEFRLGFGNFCDELISVSDSPIE